VCSAEKTLLNNLRSSGNVADVDFECSDTSILVRVTFMGVVSMNDIGSVVSVLKRVFTGYKLSNISISSPSFIDVFIEFEKVGGRR